MRSIQIFFILMLSVLSLSSFADSPAGVTVYPQIGVTTFSDSSEIDVDPNYGIGVGYQFANPWALELTYLKSDSTISDATQSDVEVYQVHLNALYHFYESEKIRPFISLGFGEADYSISNTDRNTEKQYNAGLGIKWSGWTNTDFRAGVNFYNGRENNDVRSTLNLGIHHVIHGGSKKSKQAASLVTPSTDGDRDGISDARDQCPNSPIGQVVNKVGCFADQDKDGIADANDRCPNTTNTANVIDSRGCYVAVRKPVELNILFNFDFDSAAIKPEHNNEVKKIVSFARKHSDASVELSGHTDSVGASAYNEALSKARVSAVAKLVEMNTRIAKNKISTEGFGERRHKMGNETFAERRANRRVEGTVKAIEETQKKK